MRAHRCLLVWGHGGGLLLLFPDLLGEGAVESSFCVVDAGGAAGRGLHRLDDPCTTSLAVREASLRLAKGLYMPTLAAVFREAVLPEGVHGDLKSARIRRYRLLDLLYEDVLSEVDAPSISRGPKVPGCSLDGLKSFMRPSLL